MYRATINPISSLITEKIKSVVLGYKYPSCVWFPFNSPIPVNCPAPIANFDCIILYPLPRGSDYGFKNISILFFAWSGNIKLYSIGSEMHAINNAPIMYFLSSPDVNNIIASATQKAIAVP